MISSLPVMVLMLEIISKLPPNVVAQCKTVCKEWLDFTSTPILLKAHCDYMRASGDQKLLEAGPLSCKARSLNYKVANYLLPTNISIPFNARPENFLFLATLDGMVCVCLITTWEMFVWNPLTTVFKKLSNSNSQGFYKYNNDAIGFCVDSSSDYSNAHIKRRRGTLAVYVYSMRLSSWRTVCFLKKHAYHHETFNWSPGTLCGDGLYFTVAQYWHLGQKMILRFDVNMTEFSKLRFPDVYGYGNLVVLADIKSELHMLVSPGSKEFGTVSLWKLHDDVWIKLLSYSLKGSMRFPLITSITYYNLSGLCLVMTEWGKFLEVDLRFDELGYFLPFVANSIMVQSIARL
ncbi:F-box/kelch-repeat protein At3g06240-like [Bidens hawaiensis]|uniref:F-box/kelch-repeat protein At3g06240-like n=1 Tax=Bidens hawaiensis TaxID=980011 RepID=UPI004048FEED